MSQNPIREFMTLVEGSGNGLGEPLQGTLNPGQLADLLPLVTDRNKFISAVRKIMRNDEERLSRTEQIQLANGFASLLRDDSQTKMKAIRKMMTTHLKDEPK